MPGELRPLVDGLDNLPEATLICNLYGDILVANRAAVALAPPMLSALPELPAGLCDGGDGIDGVDGVDGGKGDAYADAFGGLAPPGLPDLIEALFPVPGPGLAYWDALCAVLDAHAPVMSSDDSQGVELATEDDRRFLLHGAPLHAQAGRPSGAIVSLTDITAVRRAERQREQMLHFLSHDMRSPQASILALIDMQSRPSRALPPEELLARIAEHAHRTLALADDFIRLAQAESQRLDFAEVELTGLVLDATDELWALANARGIELRLSLEGEEGVTLRAVPALLVRAIANLVSNAIKFGPPGQPVSVRLRRMGQYMAIAVSDSGPGISYAAQGRLFEPFSRVHAPAADAPAGSGLGLVFVKTVAERHGGRVMVDSAEGAGATFTLLLPLRRRAG